MQTTICFSFILFVYQKIWTINFEEISFNIFSVFKEGSMTKEHHHGMLLNDALGSEIPVTLELVKNAYACVCCVWIFLLLFFAFWVSTAANTIQCLIYFSNKHHAFRHY